MEEDSDGPQEVTRPVDRVTPDAFTDIIEAYADEDRITSGVCRLSLEDGSERRLVIDEDLPGLDDQAYAYREIAELMDMFGESDDLLDQPIELAFPVGDLEAVLTEAEEQGTVTVFFDNTGIKSLLAHLLAKLNGPLESDSLPGTSVGGEVSHDETA